MKKVVLFILVLTLSLAVEVVNAGFTFSMAANIGPMVNSPYSDFTACISVDELSLFFSSFDFRRPLPEYFEKPFHKYHNGRAWIASLKDKSQYREGFGKMLSGQKSYKDIDPNRKRFLSDSCHGIGECICRTRVLAGSLSVVRKQFTRCTLASPFDATVKTS